MFLLFGHLFQKKKLSSGEGPGLPPVGIICRAKRMNTPTRSTRMRFGRRKRNGTDRRYFGNHNHANADNVNRLPSRNITRQHVTSTARRRKIAIAHPLGHQFQKRIESERVAEHLVCSSPLRKLSILEGGRGNCLSLAIFPARLNAVPSICVEFSGQPE